MRRGNPRRAAPAARPLPPWRAIWARPPQLFRPPRQIAREVDGARRRLGVGEHDPRRLGAVGGLRAARAPSAAGEQRRGEQGQRERPFQPLREHGVGEPGREQLALPSPAAKRRRPAPDVRARRARANARAAANGAGRAPAAQASAASSGLFQRFVVRNPENLGGGGQRGPPLPGRAGGELPAGEKEPSRGSGIAARPAEVERVAQRGLVFGAAGAAHACRGGAQGQAAAENAGPGRVFADDGVEAGRAPRRRERRLRRPFRAR